MGRAVSVADEVPETSPKIFNIALGAKRLSVIVHCNIGSGIPTFMHA
jgi:hypothetical protein